MPLFGLGRRKDGPSLAPVYLDLRSMILQVDPKDAGALPSADLPNVWGVVVDWGTDNGVATFVALADGTGSMYTSSGGGTVGGQGQPTLVEAGRRLLLAAESVHDRIPPVAGFERPKLRTVIYWLLTYGGARSASHGAEGPPAADEALTRLGAAFQDYVAAFRQLEERSAGPSR